MVREICVASFLAAIMTDTGIWAKFAVGLNAGMRFHPMMKDRTIPKYRIASETEIRSGMFRASKEIQFKDEVTA